MIILEYYQSKISHPRMRNEFKLLPSRPSYTQIGPTLPNTNAMPHIKTQAKPQNRKESQGYRQKKKEPNQIKTSNSAFYPTDSSASPHLPPYSAGTQRNYSSSESECADAAALATPATVLRADIQVLDRHLQFGKSPPWTGAGLAAAAAA